MYKPNKPTTIELLEDMWSEYVVNMHQTLHTRASSSFLATIQIILAFVLN